MFEIRDETAQAILDLLCQTKEGSVGVMFGQDLLKPLKTTEAEILESSQAKRKDTRKDEDGKALDD